MVVGPTLVSGENGKVDLVLQVVHDVLPLLVDALLSLAVEDHGAARAAQRLVRRGGDHVAVLEGAGDLLGANQAGDVGHVGEQVGADTVRNVLELLVVDEARVGRGCVCVGLGWGWGKGQ